MTSTAKLSHAESKAREAKKAVRRVVRKRQMWSREHPQTMRLETGPAYCYNGIWQADCQDSLVTLRRLLATGLDKRSREIVARNTKLLRTKAVFK